MKKLFKEHSLYLIILTLVEIIFSIIAILLFVYQDKIDVSAFSSVELLITNLYSQTWWGLVLLTMGLISIFSLTSMVYKKLEYLFISICLWVLLFIIGININGTFTDALTVSLLFIPIIIINIIAYIKEKEKIEVKKTKKKH